MPDSSCRDHPLDRQILCDLLILLCMSDGLAHTNALRVSWQSPRGPFSSTHLSKVGLPAHSDGSPCA